jgi:predicted ester cyclase
MKIRKQLGLVFVVLLAVLSMFSLAAAQGETAAPDETEEAQRAALYEAAELVTEGDFDALAEHLAEEYVLHSPMGDMDSAGLIGFLTALRTSLSGFDMVRDDVLVEGDLGATRTTFTGTFDAADFPSPMGVLPPNGQPVSVTVINVFRFDEDGLIAEEWAQFDVLGFFTQLGAFPAPAS